MANDPVVAYLDYLQQMARKIAYRGNTVDVLGRKSRRTPDRYLSYDADVDDATMQRYLAGVVGDRRLQEGRTPFIGIGLIIGKCRSGVKVVTISAPLVMVPCEVEEPDETEGSYSCTPDWQAATLNYDMLTAIIDKSDAVDAEDAMGMPDFLTPAVTTAMERAERRLREAAESKGKAQRLTDPTFIEGLASDLRAEIPALRERIATSDTPFRKEVASKRDDGLYWYNHRFRFMAQMPDSLSAFRALDKLGESLRTKRGAVGNTLRKLLSGTLSGSKVALNTADEASVEEVDRRLPQIPMPLSSRQRQAVMNAFSSEISYIQGPPGTGKSHTIVSIMQTALLLEKRVLLTCHKKAAIDVVRKKLRDMLGNGGDGADVAIYVGSDADERAKMRYRIGDLVSSVQGYQYKQQLDNAFDQKEKALEELKKTLKQADRLRQTLLGALGKANQSFRANSEHLRARASYHESFGEGDLSEKALGKIGDVDGDWEAVFDALGRAQAKRYTDEPVPASEALRARIALKRYRTRFGGSWIPKDPWNAHRLQGHYEAIKAHHRSKKAAEGIGGDLNQIRRDLETRMATAVEQAKAHLRAMFRHTQLWHARDCIDDLNNFASLFWLRKPSLIKPKMEAIDYAKITKVFPLWLGEMGDLGTILPFQPEIFDLAVVDESSQVNIAEIIPAFHRASSFCVVGDKAQLGLEAAGLFGLNRTFEQLAWNQAFAGMQGIIPFSAAKDREINVTSSSILDFVVSPTNNLNVPKVTLDEHFRSMPSLASFTSSAFYVGDGGLRVMTEVGQNLGKECFHLVETGGTRDMDSKHVPREVDATMKIIASIAKGRETGNGSHLRALGFRHPDAIPTVGVITFTSQQRDVLRARIDEEVDDADRKALDLFVGTPEEFQGNERDVMIITFALGEGMVRYASGFYENKNRFNVATSRARKYTYAVIGKCPAKATLLRRYFGHFGHRPTTDTDLGDLIDGAPAEPEVSMRGSALTWTFDERRCESEFERMVLDGIRQFIDRLPDRRLEIFNQVTTCGQKRLDFVVYDRQAAKSIAVEVDGQDHFCGDGVTYHDAHMERTGILRRAGWRIVHVPHHKWYSNGWLCHVDSERFKAVMNEFHASMRRALEIPSPGK